MGNQWNRSNLSDRFWAKVHETDDHWLWTAYVNPSGYGRFGVRDGFVTEAHRVSFYLTHGHWPVEIDHLCRVKTCVRPDHLEEVDRRTNVHRQPNVHKDRCDYGHLMTSENTYIDRKGWRSCQQCRYDAKRRHLLKKRGGD